MTGIAHIGVVGGGAWGTALACLGRRAGRKVTRWSRDRSVSAAIAHDGGLDVVMDRCLSVEWRRLGRRSTEGA